MILDLEIAEVVTIKKGLEELPFKVSAGLIVKIEQQIKTQLENAQSQTVKKNEEGK